MTFAGKVVLVTGAQQGIGRAMALEFAAAGADVAINWLDDEGAATQVAEGVQAAGRRTLLAQADVARLDAVTAMVAAGGKRGPARWKPPPQNPRGSPRPGFPDWRERAGVRTLRQLLE